jgi:glycosyltransferase involved in cell wall biosynthesis
MQKLLLDLTPLKVGGGIQLALNFLDFINLSDEIQHFVVLVSDKFPFLERLPNNCPVEIFSASPLSRMKQEHFELPKIIKKYNITHTFTFFGLGLPQQVNVRQVISIAYPTICYDDSPFWQNLTRKQYVVKKIFQYFRLNRIKKADAIIAETDVMMRRMQNQLNMTSKKITIIPPVPTSYVHNSDTFKTKTNKTFKLLVLSGLNEHKNVWRLIDVAKEIMINEDEIELMVTVDEQYFKTKYKKLLANETCQSFLNAFNFRGSIPQDKIQKVYDECDALLNLSDLESFSNNYMEAWLSNTPIIASDRDFARAILGNSAVYCEPHQPHDVYQTLVNFRKDKYDTEAMVAEGNRLLAMLPSMEQRWAMVKNVIFQESLSE